MGHTDYALVTAARDEGRYIRATIESVIEQTAKPAVWIIVSDGSRDNTDKIIKEFAEKHPFIRFLRMEDNCGRNFRSQVYAINFGVAHLDLKPPDLIGNLDADITLPPLYYENLVRKFEENPGLGLAGGWIHEPIDRNGAFAPRPMNSESSVPNALQMFRTICFEEIGGYIPLPYGGADWFAEIMARMKGWQVVAFRDLPAMHHKPSSSVEGIWGTGFRQGRMDYSMGSLPAFEVLKCCRRFSGRPPLLHTLARMIGFISGYLQKEVRPTSHDFVAFLRAEQKQRIKALFLLHR